MTSDLILCINELEQRQNADRCLICGTEDLQKVPPNKLEEYLTLLISGEAPQRSRLLASRQSGKAEDGRQKAEVTKSVLEQAGLSTAITTSVPQEKASSNRRILESLPLIIIDKPAGYEIIKDIRELPPYDTIAIDTETTGLSRDAKLLGVSFCGEEKRAFWLPADNIVPFALEATLADKQLIMHNAKFDLQVLAQNGISFYGNPLFDTMIAHQLLDENERHGLKHLAKTVLGAEVTVEQNPVIETPLFDTNSKELIEYACADADYHKTKSLVSVANTFQLYKLFEKQLKQENISRLFSTVEMPLVKIVAQMEDWGILLDTEKITALDTQLKEESKAIVQEIYEISGKPFDLNSPPQLSALLYDKLGLKSVKKTPKGAKSTDIESLEAIKDAHPIVSKILRYREIDKAFAEKKFVQID